MELENNEFNVIDGGITDADIAKWKGQNGKVMLVEIEEGDTVHKAYFKRPTLNTMAAVTKVGKTNEVESAKILLNDCWLGGSEAVKSDVVLFMEATKQLSKIFENCTSHLKNL